MYEIGAMRLLNPHGMPDQIHLPLIMGSDLVL